MPATGGEGDLLDTRAAMHPRIITNDIVFHDCQPTEAAEFFSFCNGLKSAPAARGQAGTGGRLV